MIRILNLSKSYGPNILLDEVNLEVNSGERVGLVGRNGHGKTTLFRMILKREAPDSGEVMIPKHYRIGHLDQHIRFSQKSVLAEACSALPRSEDGTDLTYRAETALEGLGFEPELRELPPGQLSGGYQVRLNLAKVLVSEPDMLILDEPTNYLDIVSMRWLGRFLREWRGEMMLITHDREFMDSVTTHTVAIHRCRLRKVAGPTEKVFSQIAQDEEVHEKTRLNQERSRRQQERFIERFRAKATKAKAVQSRIRQLEKQGGLERLEEIQDLSFRFRSLPFAAKRIMEVQGLSFRYPKGPMLFEDLTFRVGPRDRIGVIGHNGRGKTTLLSLLAGVLQPVSGRLQLHPNGKMAFYGQNNVERLDPEKTVEEEIVSVHPEGSRGVARSICGLMMFEGDEALKKVKVLSGGERSRVLMGKLLVSPANLLLLDEPTNHLDMQSTEGLMHALERFEGAVILVTHSEMILRHVANRLIVFDRGEARVYEGSYADFLERVGWSDEKAPQASGSGEVPKAPTPKQRRRLRAQFTAEKSKRLSPLLVRIDEVEKTIGSREKEMEAVEASLCRAAENGDPEPLAALGQRTGELQGEIQALYDELEDLNRRQDGVRQELEKLQSELGLSGMV